MPAPNPNYRTTVTSPLGRVTYNVMQAYSCLTPLESLNQAKADEVGGGFLVPWLRRSRGHPVMNFMNPELKRGHD